MATPASVQEIITNSTCYQCNIPPGYELSALVYLFSQIAGVTDIQTIVTEAKCYQQCIPEGYQMAALIYLANQILANSTSD